MYSIEDLVFSSKKVLIYRQAAFKRFGLHTLEVNDEQFLELIRNIFPEKDTFDDKFAS